MAYHRLPLGSGLGKDVSILLTDDRSRIWYNVQAKYNDSGGTTRQLCGVSKAFDLSVTFSLPRPVAKSELFLGGTNVKFTPYASIVAASSVPRHLERLVPNQTQSLLKHPKRPVPHQIQSSLKHRKRLVPYQIQSLRTRLVLGQI